MRRDRVVKEVLGEEGLLAPSDLYTRRFKKAFAGGYNSEAVHAFLERVADQLEDHIAEAERLRRENKELKAQLEEYRSLDSSLRGALTASQKFGEDIIETARREAEALLQETRVRMAEEEFAAHKRAVAVDGKLAAFRHQRARFRADMLGLLETHRNLVEDVLRDDEASTGPEHHAPDPGLNEEAPHAVYSIEQEEEEAAVSTEVQAEEVPDTNPPETPAVTPASGEPEEEEPST